MLNPVMALLALLGAVIALASRHPPPAIAMGVAILLWITFVHEILQSDPRYTIPYRSIEAAIAIFAITSLITSVVRPGYSRK